jgi:hypothetical protein
MRSWWWFRFWWWLPPPGEALDSRAEPEGTEGQSSPSSEAEGVRESPPQPLVFVPPVSPSFPWPILGPIDPYVPVAVPQSPPPQTPIHRGAREPGTLVLVGGALLGIALGAYYSRSRRAP